MKELKQVNIFNRSEVPLIITCPVCGFTFKIFDLRTRKNNQLCPICGYHLILYFKLRKENLLLE